MRLTGRACDTYIDESAICCCSPKGGPETPVAPAPGGIDDSLIPVVSFRASGQTAFMYSKCHLAHNTGRLTGAQGWMRAAFYLPLDKQGVVVGAAGGAGLVKVFISSRE